MSARILTFPAQKSTKVIIPASVETIHFRDLGPKKRYSYSLDQGLQIWRHELTALGVAGEPKDGTWTAHARPGQEGHVQGAFVFHRVPQKEQDANFSLWTFGLWLRPYPYRRPIASDLNCMFEVVVQRRDHGRRVVTYVSRLCPSCGRARAKNDDSMYWFRGLGSAMKCLGCLPDSVLTPYGAQCIRLDGKVCCI